MRKLVIALSLTSVVFAASTLYFARELSLERDRSGAPRAPAGSPALASARSQPVAVTADAPAPPIGEASPERARMNVEFVSEPAAAAQAISPTDIKKMQAEYGKSFLARLTDPERREEMLDESKMIVRYTYPRVDQVLGLSPAEHSRLIELFALQQMDAQEKGARCMMDPVCQVGDMQPQDFDTRKREIEELLGGERARKFETYKNTMSEREAVSQLRNRLPDVHRLNDANTELLIAALAEERDFIQREASQRGASTNGFGIGAGLILAPGDDGTFEERYEAARQNSQRLRDRASQFLNADQMRAFNDMQDETLISLRAMLRQKDSMSFSAGGLAVADPAH